VNVARRADVPPIGSPEFFEDPYPTYAAARENPSPSFDPFLGAWVITRFDDVASVLGEKRLASTGRVHALLRRTVPDAYSESRWIAEHFDRTLPFLAPPRHTVIRALLMRVLTPRRVEGLRPGIEQLVKDLLDDATGPEIDLAETLTLPLPMAVISLLLDVPQADAPLFVKWTKGLFSIFSPASEVPSVLPRVSSSLHEATAYLGYLVADRKRNPGDDMISLLIEARDEDGHTLSDAEVVSNCLTMYTAGHETTQGLLGNGITALLQSEQASSALRQSSELIGTAVEEMLRFDSPLQRGWRVASEDLDVAGADVREGDLVAFFLGAANRDPLKFVDADIFDVRRSPNRHLAFGYGPHFCVGAGLARLEAEIAVRQLLSRYRRLELGAAPPIRRPDITFRILDRLPVRVEA
jgi:cytochrome P450